MGEAITDKPYNGCNVAKKVVIKVPRFQEEARVGRAMEKISHEIRIVEHFRTKFSGYILKYYKAAKFQDSFGLSGYLLMDYVQPGQGSPLSSFI